MNNFPVVQGVFAHSQNDILKKTVIIKLPLVSIVYPGDLMFNGAKIARATFDIPKMVYQE